jgi:CDP-diacylglycerol---glycerol-3-phosphate 3-phosphatidyltransferase
MIAFTYIAMIGSLMVSYTKARAEGLGLECKTGLLARPERVIILAIGLLTNTGIWAIALLAVFANVTAVERILSIWRTTTRQSVGKGVVATSYKQDASTNNRQPPETVGTNETREPDVRPVPTIAPPFSGGVHQE